MKKEEREAARIKSPLGQSPAFNLAAPAFPRNDVNHSNPAVQAMNLSQQTTCRRLHPPRKSIIISKSRTQPAGRLAGGAVPATSKATPGT